MSNTLMIDASTLFQCIRERLIQARRNVAVAVNQEMVRTYWDIGKYIFEACGEEERAGYGKQVLQALSQKLCAEFGKGFDVRELRRFRQFYTMFPIRGTLCPELSWSYYRLLLRVQNDKARDFYAKESQLSGWSVRQLQRQITTFYYERLLSSQDSDRYYMHTNLPTEHLLIDCF